MADRHGERVALLNDSVTCVSDGGGGDQVVVETGGSFASNASRDLSLRWDNSIIIVCSTWAQMQGSTLITLPKFFREAGYVQACIIAVIVGFVNCNTCLLLVRLGRRHKAFGHEQVVQKLWPWVLQKVPGLMSVFIFQFGMVLFHTYLTDSILFFIKKGEGGSLDEDKVRPLVAIGIGVAVFLTGLLRSINALVRVSSATVLIIFFLLGFVAIQSAKQLNGTKMDVICHEDGKEYGVGFQGVGPIVRLASMLSVSFLVHNGVLPVLSESTRPQHNMRNTALAYTCAVLFTCIPSSMAAIAFKHCDRIPGNFIEMFTGPFSDAARAFVSLLTFMIYPLIFFILRSQVLCLKWANNNEWPYWVHVLAAIPPIVISTGITAAHASLNVVVPVQGTFGNIWCIVLPTLMDFMQHKKDGTLTLWVKARTAILCTYSAVLITCTLLLVSGAYDFDS